MVIGEVLDRIALLFCLGGVTALMLLVSIVGLLWIACETERSRRAGRSWRGAAGRRAPQIDRSLPAG